MGSLRSSTLVTPDRLDRPFSDPLVERLFPPLATGVHWGLERTERALASLGDPQRTFRALHIGGTNGKGSVTATLASILHQGGRRAGCYTSPHLCSFRERIVVAGAPLKEDPLLGYAEEVRAAVVGFGLTFFEAVTVLAFHAFAREEVEVAAVEVGLGGRLDATNILTPEVSAVTNVAMDHADYLGNTLGQIAREKAGIIKPRVPFVTADANAATLAVFEERAAEVDAPLFRLPPEAVRDVSVRRDRTTFRAATRSFGDLEITTPLVGRHHAINAALAMEILGRAPSDLHPTAPALLEGIRSVRHRGRDEIRVIEGLTWLFDVAHNTAGVESLVDTMDRVELPRPLVLLIGVLGDKAWGEMLPPLLSRADGAVLTVPPSAPAERLWNPVAAAEAVHAGPSTAVVTDFTEAVREAIALAGEGTVVATGSVHTVGSAMCVLGLDPLG